MFYSSYSEYHHRFSINYINSCWLWVWNTNFYKEHSEAEHLTECNERGQREKWDTGRKRGTEEERAYQRLIVPSSARRLYDTDSFSSFWSLKKNTSVNQPIQYKSPASFFTVLHNTWHFIPLFLCIIKQEFLMCLSL